MSDIIADTAAPAAPEAPEAAQGGVDWSQLKQALPEDIRGDKSLEPITSVEGLVKSYIHAQKAIGTNKLSVPDKHATDEDWRQVFHKLGVPEKVEEYKIDAGGDVLSEEFVEGFRAQAHKAGVLPKQATEMAKWYSSFLQERAEAEDQKEAQVLEENVSALKKEWGKAYEEQVEKSKIALKHLLPDEGERKALLEMGVGRSAAFVKMLSKVAGFLSEDVFVGQGAAQFTTMTPEVALEKARSIQGDWQHPYRNPEHPNHESAKKEVADLYRAAFPDQ